MNIQPKKYYDMMGMQSGDSDLKNKNIGEVKKYWWISCQIHGSNTSLVSTSHPFFYAKTINSREKRPIVVLLNYKEITKKEYELF